MTGYVESLLGNRERIILVARQHWFILVGSIVLEIEIILILISLTILAGVYWAQFALLIGAIGTILLLLPLSTLMRDILDWMNRQYIVTNRRVIQISGILNKIAMLNAKELLEQGEDLELENLDVVEVIASLDRLRELGILSEEEFTRKKTELLVKL